jgi:hypothetical protein
MPRLHSLTSPHSPPAPTAPGLRVIDETPRPAAPPRRPQPRWDALSPMPLAGAQAAMQEELREPDEDFFERDFLPSRQAGEDGKLKELPRFVPLQCEVFSTGGDPWTVRSVGDLLKLYLPEISISTAVVVASGVLAGRLVSRFGGGSLGPEVLASYLAIHSLFLALVYASAKGTASARGKGRMRNHLLGTFVLLGFHLLAYGLLVAGR